MKKRIILYIYIVVTLFFVGCSLMVEDFKKTDTVINNTVPVISEQPGKLYTIIEEFESLDNDEIDSSLTKITSARINPAYFSPAVPEGFELFPENKTFENDVLTIKYTRKRITLTFDPHGGEWDLTDGVHKLEGKYGERLPLIDITQIKKVDAKFAGWTENPDKTPVTTVRIPETYPAENHTYYSVWDEVNSNYIVKIWEENITYSDPAKKYTLVAMNAAAGIPGHESNYKAISRYGFDVLHYDQVTIGDVDKPSVSLNVYYDRRIFTYSFDLDAAYAKWTNTDHPEHNNDHAERYISGKYEADFTEYDCIKCFRDESTGKDNNGEDLHGDVWNFEGWNEVGGKVALKFTQNRHYSAVWDKGPPEYTIRHIFEQTDGSYDTDSRYPDEKYSAGSEIYTKAKAYDGIPGYYALPFEQQKINGNSTVVEIKYNRATVTVTWNANGGSFGGEQGEQIIKRTGKYLDPIPNRPSNPTKDYHVFDHWQSVHDEPSPTEFPDKNIRYEAVYKRTGALFGVEYYLENITDEKSGDDNYTMSRHDSETKVGGYSDGTPVPVSFEVKSYKGFEYSHAYKDDTKLLDSAFANSTVTIASGIAENDSTVIKVYLKRKRFDVTFDPNGLIWNSDGMWNGQNNSFEENGMPRTLKNLKYDTPINAVRTDFHSQDAREVFKEWEPVFTGVVTDEENQKYTAVTISKTVPYKIRYLFETLDCPDNNRVYVQDPAFPDVATENERELPGFRTKVVVPAEKFAKGGDFYGFELNNNNSEHDIIVSEDESKNIVNIKLDRKRIELEFVANRNSEENAEWPNGVKDVNRLEREVIGKYGASVVLPSDLNEVKWIAEKGDNGKLMKFVGWETEGNGTSGSGELIDVSTIRTFPPVDMKYYAKWEEIESNQASNDDGNGIIDSAEKDIELKATLVDGTLNTYIIKVILPFETTEDGLKKWTIRWKQAGNAEFTKVSTQDGFTEQQFTIDYFKNTIYVEAKYEGLAVPFNKEITLKVKK